MNAPILGIDGSLGYPAYSGSVSNPMLASALITVRESSLAGNATHGLYRSDYTPVRPPFLQENDVDWRPRTKVQGLQANVRAALIEMELLRNIQFVESEASAGVALVDGGPTIATLGRLTECVFQRQLQLVASFAALRAERSLEILTQVVPQSAHWSSIAGLSPERHRYTWELIGIGLRFAMMVTMQLKYALNVARPWALSAVVQPMLLTPGYTAYPSGHATEAHFVAELIPLLVGDPTHPHSESEHADRKDGIAAQLNRLAFRIAENRVVAGLHYPVDSIAGQVLGVMLARYLVWLTGDPLPRFKKKTLDVGAIAFPQPGAIDGDTERPAFDCFVDQQEHVEEPSSTLPSKVPPAPVLRDLWALARREWA
ncbi:phosphatase PAP2 family protein [Acidovorax facilis]|uniref:phosphatase PAP2 family protein n=1 Tax=Acidovorax facilis TaxID=12917 RepID=UPI003CEAA251